MKNNLTLLPLLLLLSSLLFSSCQPTTAPEQDFDQFVDELQEVLTTFYHEYPDAIGIMAHVEIPELSWSGGIGLSDREGRQPLKSQQPALIASITKTFVAATILRLHEMALIDLNAPIDKYLTSSTVAVLQSDGYRTNEITVTQLLNHTSGINDYVETESFLQKTKSDVQYQWTRDEQIQLAVSELDPVDDPGKQFRYSDTNYLLLTEIIEHLTQMPFYEAMRTHLNYNQLQLNHTWFVDLEAVPDNTLPLVHQYYSSQGLDTYQISKTFDLYGGGGLACTTRDLATFLHQLFNHKVFNDRATVKLMRELAPGHESSDYSLGLFRAEINDFIGWGHSGYWGTMANYFPKLDASIAVFVLEKDRKHLNKEITAALLKKLQEGQ